MKDGGREGCDNGHVLYATAFLVLIKILHPFRYSPNAMAFGMMSTVGVYAAGFGATPTTKSLAGSGNEAVSAPNTGTVTLGYQTTGDSVTGILVTWTPSATGDYDLAVVAGGTPSSAWSTWSS